MPPSSDQLLHTFPHGTPSAALWDILPIQPPRAIKVPPFWQVSLSFPPGQRPFHHHFPPWLEMGILTSTIAVSARTRSIPYREPTVCKNPPVLEPGGTQIGKIYFLLSILKIILKSKYKFCLGNVPTYMFFLWNMGIEMRHFNHKEPIPISCFLFWTCWVQSATNSLHGGDPLFYGWRREREKLFLQHSLHCLPTMPNQLCKKPYFYIRKVGYKKQMWV